MDLDNAAVHPKRVRLPFPDNNGHYIVIHDRLNAGEVENLHAEWQPVIKSGVGVELQTRQIRFAKVRAYLLDWSLKIAGEPWKIDKPEERDAAIENLDPAIFTAIHKMIEAHETKRDAEVEAMKSDPPGATESSATLPSVAP